MKLSYIVQDENVQLFPLRDGTMTPITVASTHPNFSKVVDALKEERYEDAVSLADIPTHVQEWSEGAVAVTGGTVTYKGSPLHNSLTSRILRMLEEGFDATPLLNFLDNLMLNPSKQSVTELYDFLDFSDLPITEDGCILAYKAVTEDYKDCYTRTLDNSVGATVEMERNEVDDNRENTCSDGLHFTSLTGYAKWFGGSSTRVMAIKINPRDVVSIPKDYNNKKGRCCKYVVVAEITKEVMQQEREVLEEKVVVSSTGEEWDYANIQ